MWSSLLLAWSMQACSLAGTWDTHGRDPSLDTGDTGGGDNGAGDNGAGDTASADGGLVISELMKDPDAVSDDDGEWFEVTNVGSADLDLDGWEVTGDDGGFPVEGSLVVPSGGRLVFGVSADPSINGGVTPDYVYSVDDVKLSNEGGTLTITHGDALVDRVTWDQAEFPDDKGRSLSLDPTRLAAADNDDPSAWCSSTTTYGAGDAGTPDAPNDGCGADSADRDGDGALNDADCAPDDPAVHPGAPEVEDGVDNDCDGWADERAPGEGDLLVNEIMDDPDPTDDATGEWVELLSVATVPLVVDTLDLADEHGEAARVKLGVVLPPSSLLLLAASDDPDQNGGIVPDAVFDRGDFHLENDADEIILSVGDVVTDEVAYDGDFPHQSGKTRSLDPDHATADDNDDPDAWCEGDGHYGSDDNQGTPGETNDECP